MASYAPLTISARASSRLVPPLRAARRGLRRDGAWRAATIAADALALVLGILIAGAASPGVVMLFALPLLLALASAFGLYRRGWLPSDQRLVDAVPAILLAAVVVLALALLGGWIRAAELTLPGLATILVVVPSGMLLGRWFTSRIRARTSARERCVVIGDRTVAEGIAREIRAREIAAVDWVTSLGAGSEGLRTAAVERALREREIDWIVLAPGPNAGHDLGRLARRIDDLQTRISVLPGLLRRDDRVEVRWLVKRTLDLALACLALVVLAPLLVAIAVAIKLDSPGPVLFVQRRVGRDGWSFRMIKFRTMTAGAHERRSELDHMTAAGGLFKIREDPRVTRVGRTLRTSCLDELPQLWNVLRGEMSLVGPRPLLVEEDCRIDGERRYRHSITPGMTGSWQLLGFPRPPFDEMVKLDAEYARSWSLAADMKLLARTIPYIVRFRGI